MGSNSSGASQPAAQGIAEINGSSASLKSVGADNSGASQPAAPGEEGNRLRHSRSRTPVRHEREDQIRLEDQLRERQQQSDSSPSDDTLLEAYAASPAVIEHEAACAAAAYAGTLLRPRAPFPPAPPPMKATAPLTPTTPPGAAPYPPAWKAGFGMFYTYPGPTPRPSTTAVDRWAQQLPSLSHGELAALHLEVAKEVQRRLRFM